MIRKVEFPARLARQFKRAAKVVFPREEFAIVVGLRPSPDIWQITDLYFPPERLKHSTPYQVMIDHVWHHEVHAAVKRGGFSVIGDIHSHCYDNTTGVYGALRDTSPSEGDWARCEPGNGCLPHREMVHGVCSLVKNHRNIRGYIRFWPQVAKIETAITR